jgi:hypothetical protein
VLAGRRQCGRRPGGLVRIGLRIGAVGATCSLCTVLPVCPRWRPTGAAWEPLRERARSGDSPKARTALSRRSAFAGRPRSTSRPAAPQRKHRQAPVSVLALSDWWARSRGLSPQAGRGQQNRRSRPPTTSPASASWPRCAGAGRHAGAAAALVERAPAAGRTVPLEEAIAYALAPDEQAWAAGRALSLDQAVAAAPTDVAGGAAGAT